MSWLSALRTGSKSNDLIGVNAREIGPDDPITAQCQGETRLKSRNHAGSTIEKHRGTEGLLQNCQLILSGLGGVFGLVPEGDRIILLMRKKIPSHVIEKSFRT